MRQRAIALQVVLALAVGCDGQSLADAGVAEDAAAGVRCDDANDVLGGAEDARLDDADGALGAIDCAGDVDYYAFDATDGTFVRLYVVPSATADGRVVDPVLTLYDPAGRRLAENDDGVEGIGPIGSHPMIVTRLPVSGRYYVRVDEFRHWSGRDVQIGAPDLVYTLHAVTIDATSQNAVVDPETGNDAASATPLRFRPRTLSGVPIDFGYAVGMLDGPRDVDVFSFEITGAASSVTFGAMIHVPGADGSGSTARPGHLWITDPTGALVFGATDTSAESGLVRVAPSLANGSYLLWVDRSTGPAGANDFYVVAVTRAPIDNPRESAGAANDTLAGADPLELAPVHDMRQAAILSFLPERDVDYFSFTVPETCEIADIGCSAAWDGSGLRGLRAELRDASDALITGRSEDAMLPEQLRLDPVPFRDLAAGIYYLRLSAADQDPWIVGNWVRCMVTTRPVQ